jgi:hypothetical protein
MEEKEVRETIFSAVYRIVRILKQPTIDDFFKQTIESTVGEIQQAAPSGWEDFWWESLATEIQTAFIARKLYILDFGKQWLKDNKAKTWEALYEYLDKQAKLVPF